MKKLIALILPLVFVTAAFAQEHMQKTPEERAKMQTQHMTKDLSLSADQQKKVQDINLDAAKKMDALHASTSNDHQAMMDGMKKISAEKDAALKAVLDEKQYSSYLTMKQARMEKMKSEKNRKGKPTEGKKDSIK